MEYLAGYSIPSGYITSIFGLWLAYFLLRALYNILPLHPLNHIPGPKLAAATFLYEAWFDLVLGGRYTHQIKRMHEKYGPVVRINPEELHFNDMKFFDEIYAGGGRRRDKQQHFLNFIAGPFTLSMFATRDHDLHRVRRGAINKFFSRGQISKLESDVKDLAHQLCDKMIRLGNRDKAPFDLTTVYSCFASDVISGYCFGESFGFVAQDEWEPNFREPLNAFLEITFFFRFFPLFRMVTEVGPLFAKRFSNNVRNMLLETNERMPARVRKAIGDYEAGVTHDRPTIFATILDSQLPDTEKREVRLGGEGFSLITAGTETTAWTLTVITFYLLNQPDTLACLTKELQDADALNLSWLALEKLPYLSAVISEGLRLAYGVGCRLARIAPTETLVYRGEFNGHKIEYLIPSGTAMGMSSAIIHHNEDIFPESHAFTPERWVEVEEAQKRRMDGNLTSFNKGTRQCVAMNLAYCNLYVAVTALTLRVYPQMSLYQTGVKDVQYDRDLFVPRAHKGSQGVRAVIS
ncbi:cytochrome P450 [Aspergillus granulosus]|uniref:Cytochrome P450 n=1 Tax=Aspergillus granulosus TaxID=176169 RepID=A0ABR4GT95_9EURO